MKTNNHQLIELWDEALRRLGKEADRVEEESRDINVYMQLFKAAKEKISENDDLHDEVERQQAEIDDLNEQLEQKDAEMANMQREMQAEIDDLRRQLLEAQNEHLESEKQQLVAEVKAKPMEIHNHFEPGSNSQVFNDKVSGKFQKLEKLTKSEKLTKKDKKDKKNKRWKKIVRKML